MGALPSLVTWFVASEPAAVVQPISVAELQALIHLAEEHAIPIVPRGAGTAGHGGAVPTRGGIVVDFYRMSCILDVDAAAGTATVEPGVTWQDLEEHLRVRGLALPLYPTSAISATVGGWIANGGGAGIGSFRYGYIRDNLVEVELVTPAGVETLSCDALDLVSGLAGTTGFISRVTLCVREAAEEVPLLAAFDGLEALLAVAAQIKEREFDLWHLGYFNATHAALSGKAIEEQVSRDIIHHDKVELPELPSEGILALFVGGDSQQSELKSLIQAEGGEVLAQEVAKHHWEERFYTMRLKALGPSLIASEVVIPGVKLPQLAERVRKRLGQQVAFHGTFVRGNAEATFLALVLDDERRRTFTLAYPLSLLPVAEAKKLGGRPYTIGMFFTQDAADYFGPERLARLFQFKEKVDPKRILNPGKIFPPSWDKGSPLGRLNLLIKLGHRFGGLLSTLDRWLPRRSATKVWNPKSVLGRQPLSQGLAWDAFSCSGCGYCRTRCTQFGVFGWESASPRGKFQYLRQNIQKSAQLDQRMADMFFMCATCRRCDPVCQVRIPILQHWDLTMRPVLWDEGYELPLHFQGTIENVLTTHNPTGHPHEKRTEWVTPEIRYQDKGELGYWVGCTASYAIKSLAENPLRILNAAGIEPVLFRDDEWCCGCDMMLYGCFEDVYDTVAHNIDAINKRGVKTLITHCPGCWSSFALYYPILAQRLNRQYNIKAEHITETLARLVKEGKIAFHQPLDMKVTYHDSCHIGRRGYIFEAPREVIRAMPGVELVEMPRSRENAPCCGRQLFAYTDTGPKPYVERAVEAVEAGAEALITNCPGCQVAYILGAREAAMELQVLDITDLVAMSMGITVRDPKIIARMARQAYDRNTKPKVQQEASRARAAFAPNQESYDPLPGRSPERGAD